MYFYCLSVNYNNRSPGIGNDSQNGIHCHRRATIIYKLANNTILNNSVACCQLIMTVIVLFSYGYVRHKIDDRKNGPASRAILMAMRIRQYGAERIAQYGRSRTTLVLTSFLL